MIGTVLKKMGYKPDDDVGQQKIALEAKLKEGMPSLPVGQFSVIIADPPWKYSLRERDKSHRGRCIYPPMETEDIKAMDVGAIAAKNAYLMLWCTKDYLEESYAVARAWGFEPKSMHVWRKVTKDGSKVWFGIGHYGRNACEFCLVARRGAIPTWMALGLGDIPNCHDHRRLKHSEKPDFMHVIGDRISDALKERDAMYSQEGDRVELFSRRHREGWLAWGLEAQ